MIQEWIAINKFYNLIDSFKEESQISDLFQWVFGYNNYLYTKSNYEFHYFLKCQYSNRFAAFGCMMNSQYRYARTKYNNYNTSVHG